MSDKDFYDFLFEATGSAADLQTFSQRHLARGAFSFNSIRAMPPELDYEFNNFVSDGYDTLFGDWTDLTGRWMFKEAAAERGYPFPLQSREQVLECTKALGEFGEQRLALGRLFKANLDTHGFGHAAEWRTAHWGCSEDVDETIASIEIDSIAEPRVRLSCNCYGAPPRPLFVQLSAMHPELRMRVVAVSQSGKHGSQFGLFKGKAQTLPKIAPEQAAEQVQGFRREAGLPWLRHIGYPQALLSQIEMSERGYPVFSGAKVSLRLARDCLRRGESTESFASRFPELSAAQGQCLALLPNLLG